MRGFLVTFEGIDGCGKSSQIEHLEAGLRARGIAPLITREPGGTSLGESIRDILLDPSSAEMTMKTEVLLYEASRAQHVEQIIRPALNNGRLVLCERYVDSTVAYQGYGGGCDPEEIRLVNSFATGGLTPDITILLDIDPDLGLKRRAWRSPDRIEGRAVEYYKRVREGYLAIAKAEPGRVKIVDASAGMKTVGDRIFELVTAALGPDAGLRGVDK